MSSTAITHQDQFSAALRKRPAARWAPLSGIAFVVIFLASVVASNAPADTASGTEWVAAYTGQAKQAGHLATGILLVLAALSLMTFLVVLWTRIAEIRRPAAPSLVPIIAAAVSAACIAAGGVVMAGISGAALIGSAPLPSPDLLRFANDTGFAMVSVGGMLAAALSVACLSTQAHAAGLFGQKMKVFGLVVAVTLLAAITFVPIAALLVWLLVTSVTLIRRDGTAARPVAME
jgi:hypothetical protein